MRKCFHKRLQISMYFSSKKGSNLSPLLSLSSIIFHEKNGFSSSSSKISFGQTNPFCFFPGPAKFCFANLNFLLVSIVQRKYGSFTPPVFSLNLIKQILNGLFNISNKLDCVCLAVWNVEVLALSLDKLCCGLLFWTFLDYTCLGIYLLMDFSMLSRWPCL